MGDAYSAIIRKVAYRPDAKPEGKVYAVLGRSSSCDAMFEAEMTEGGWWFKEKLIIIYAKDFEEAKYDLNCFMQNSN